VGVGGVALGFCPAPTLNLMEGSMDMISPKQQRVFDFIKGYITSNGVAPTFSEIGRHFQMKSSASVHQVLAILEREGRIKKVPNVSRGMQIVEQR
jgi:repressor LexA